MKKLFFCLLVSVTFFSSCTKEPTATKILMQGNWQLTAATDANGNDILSKVTFPVTVIQLTDDNGMLGTHAPLATRVVYGDTKWTEASGKMNQLFDYANFRFNTGEFFVGEGSVDNFTIEFKLQATAIGGGVLSDVLSIFGVANGWLQQTVYHKFTNVKISFPGQEATIFTSKAKEERKHDLQYAAIAIGLICFIILFFALSRSIIVKTKFIEFFGNSRSISCI